MATFRNDKDQKKWDEIQKTVSTPLNKMFEGQATGADIKTVAEAIRRYDDLAAKLFDEGIAGAEASADAFLDKLNKDRIETGKAPLTPKAHDRLYKQTFQRILAESTTDIIGSVQDYLDSKFDEQEKSTATQISSAFEQVRAMLEKRGTLAREGERTDQVAKKAAQSVSNSVQQMLNTVGKRSTDTQVVAPSPVVTAPSPFEALKSYLTPAPRIQVDRDRAPTLGERARSLFSREDVSTMGISSLKEFKERRGLQSDAKVKANVRSDYEADPDKAKTVPLKEALISAVAENQRLTGEVESEWQRILGYRGEGEDKGSKKKREKDSLFSRIKGLVSSKHARSGGIVTSIIGGLALALTNPQLIGTIWEAAKKVFDFDTITGFLTDSWNMLKDTGMSAVTWVLDKVKSFFGFGKGNERASSAKTATPGQMSNAQANVALQGARRERSQLSQKIEETKQLGRPIPPALQQQFNTADAKVKRLEGTPEGTPAAPTGSKPSSTEPTGSKPSSTEPTGSPAPPASSTAVSAASITSASSAAIPSAANINVNSRTSVVPETDVTYKPGEAIDAQATSDNTSAEAPRDKAVAGSISLNSFGMHSQDDMLTLYNTRIC